VFWVSYFVYARGENMDVRNALFDTVCSKKMSTMVEYRESWHTAHENLMVHFITKFNNYFERWLSSPAGVAYKGDQSTYRYFYFMSFKWSHIVEKGRLSSRLFPLRTLRSILISMEPRIAVFHGDCLRLRTFSTLCWLSLNLSL
jgi:hypothetical protein